MHSVSERMLKSIDQNNNLIPWVIGLYFVLFLTFSIINDRFHAPDFAVYFNAADNFIHHEAVYNRQYGVSQTGIYKYSPFALFLFVPLTVFSEFTARLIYTAILALSLVYLLFFTFRFLSRRFGMDRTSAHRNRILLLSFLITAVHIHRELELGNINLLLLLILLGSLHALLVKRHIFSGVLLGIAILVKPHFIVFLPWLLLRKEWRAIAIVPVCLIAGFLLPVLITGWEQNLAFHREWLQTMLVHNSDVQLVENPNTLHRWIWVAGLGRLISNAGAAYFACVILTVGLIFLAFMRINRKMKPSMREEDGTMEFLVLLALIPNITHTDTEHFLLSLPLIAFIFMYWFSHSIKSKSLMYLTVIGFIFYGANWYEVWRRDLSIWIEKAGFLGIGNLIIIAMAIYYFWRWKQDRGKY